MKDIRALMIIDQNLDLLNTTSQEKQTEDEYNFYLFLSRRKAYCLIELQHYDAASEILNHILELDPENKFAKQELAYIRQISKN